LNLAYPKLMQGSQRSFQAARHRCLFAAGVWVRAAEHGARQIASGQL